MENLIANIGLNLIQGLVLLIFSPLIMGIINKVKARLQKRMGASIFQEYFDLFKWWRKPTIITPYTTSIFILAPVVYFMTSLYAATMVPGFLTGQFSAGDAFIFVYILALGRFFMTLSSMDAATSFGGMGGSREIYVSVLVEPAIMLAILINSLRYHSTTLSGMIIDYDGAYFTISAVLTCIAFFLVMLAENSRLPVDNPDTHLELTMIHEGMTLEYSGKLLTLIHLGSYLKIIVFLTLFGALYFPINIPLWLKILLGAVIIGIVETLNNKMRLFKVRVYLGAAIVFLLLAIVAE
ncbi:MAG: NADH-quinone oxidoreductase subunit H [Anaerovibrio sp.]|uniref:respiratory chain complex I subunit 1 family protein n=1 Tax=Anaerovibrio sp. TaxID=1872532 RepID=UPI0025E33768|nr:NADH-quinone oxidoreductase subunit H [Anaerovibrio sp.]MCR5175497.1 NADH-quinone oxidoreductase subunit H [Anaerovibrio sp.]